MSTLSAAFCRASSPSGRFSASLGCPLVAGTAQICRVCRTCLRSTSYIRAFFRGCSKFCLAHEQHGFVAIMSCPARIARTHSKGIGAWIKADKSVYGSKSQLDYHLEHLCDVWNRKVVQWNFCARKSHSSPPLGRMRKLELFWQTQTTADVGAPPPLFCIITHRVDGVPSSNIDAMCNFRYRE